MDAQRDAAEAATEAGFSVDRKQVILEPIKELGIHSVKIVLHPEVSATITINVARTEEEAKRQAAGEDLTGRQDEAEETVEATEFFESEELAPTDGEDEADAAEETENKE